MDPREDAKLAKLVEIGFGVDEAREALHQCKKIHDFFQDPQQVPPAAISKATAQFVRECQLMSTLRHPNIVQVLGLLFLSG